MASGYNSLEYSSGEYKNRINAQHGAGVQILFSLLVALVALACGSQRTLAAAAPAHGVTAAVASVTRTGAITNTVTVGSSTFDPNPVNNTAVQTTTITGVPITTPTATPAATVTATPTAPLTATATATAADTGTPTAPATPTATETTTVVSTPSATATPSTTGVATAAPTATTTAINTVTPAPTASATATALATVTPTVTATLTPTATPTATDTVTATPTNPPTATDTPTVTITPVPTATPTATATVTATPTPTNPPTATDTPTVMPSFTVTATATATPSLTPTATDTVTPTPSPTATATVTPVPTPTATATATPIPPVILGDLVWLDRNANGLQEPDEPGLATVQVTLYQADGPMVATTVTDGRGFYHFAGVAPGDYFLVFTPPVINGQPYTFSPVDQGDQSGSGAADSDANPATGQTALISLGAGQIDGSWDAGFYPPLRLGNLVWHDKNNNGWVDGNEPGLANVTVQLFREGATPGSSALLTTDSETGATVTNQGDTPLATTTTDANGLYLFGNLPPGRYFIYIPTPPVDYPVSSIPTDVTDNSEDGDDNGHQEKPGGAVRGPVVELRPQSETTNDGDDANGDLSQDFGFLAYATIGDLVWYDRNQDGLQGANETSVPNLAETIGVPGIAVTLYDASANQIVATTVTNSQGHYAFGQILPGNYYVHFTLPVGYGVTTPHASIPNTGAPSDAFDSDVDPATQNTPVVVLRSGDNKPTLDLGIYLLDGQQPALLGDWVWHDANGNGVQDATESGVPGVTVSLYRSDGALVATTKTDVEGYYLFTGLPSGDYFLRFAPPAGYLLAPLNQGDQATADAFDSDVDPATGQTAIISLGMSQTDLTQDAGLTAAIPPGNLYGSAWFDANQNGIREPADSGISGVTVSLYRTDGALLATTVTGPDGQYAFINLGPGDYYLLFVTPADYRATPVNQGTDDTVDSDVLSNDDGLTAQTPIITLHPGESLFALDYGLLPFDPTDPRVQTPVRIGNRVWLDANTNGNQEPEESGVADIVVKLYNGSGELIATTTTDSSGTYLFSNLPPGAYFVEFVIADNFSFSPLGLIVGSDSDSNAEPTTGRTGLITLQPGAQDLTWDAGIYQKPTNLADGAEPNTPNRAIYLPLVARKGIKVKPKEGVPKPMIPCDRKICATP